MDLYKNVTIMPTKKDISNKYGGKSLSSFVPCVLRVKIYDISWPPNEKYLTNTTPDVMAAAD